MSVKLIGRDIEIMRRRYDEALKMQGIPCKYQYPILANSNIQGESVVDGYSDYIDADIFFDTTPKIKTFRRYGWVVANDANLPFLLHCSWNLPKVQKDSLFTLAGLYTEVGNRVFRVTEITYDAQAPDHIVCQVVPVYSDTDIVGRTKKEVAKQFNKSNYFMNQPVDYRGRYRTDEDGDVE